MNLNDFQDLIERTRNEMKKAVKGQDDIIDLLFVSLFSRGHCLLEGPPGTAKTLIAQAFSHVAKLKFGRVQFTPDLLPSDVIGVNIYNFQSNEFHLTKGPIFTDLLLADEINRAPPKTQSSLLQAMNEKVVTIDGVDHKLSKEFFVLATQNPIEQHGTYPLPEAQLDRFLFKLILDFPDRDQEIEILKQSTMRALNDKGGLGEIKPIISRKELAAGFQLVDDIRLETKIIDYIVDLVRATRSDPMISHGASTRAANAISSAVRAKAALDGREYAIPDDVQALFLPALRHRIVLTATAEIEAKTADDVLNAIMKRVDAPR